MLAATNANAYISIAGAGEPADKIIRTQLSTQPKEVQDIANAIMDTLLMGKTVSTVNKAYYALFRPSVQPYLISWFKYNPADENKKAEKYRWQLYRARMIYKCR